jgi:hypothetical protein
MTTDKERRRQESAEEDIARSFEALDATQSAILERFGGPLTEEQKESLGDLLRLDQSLNGPDDVLDQELYSRPFPPAPLSKRSRYQQDSETKGQ